MNMSNYTVTTSTGEKVGPHSSWQSKELGNLWLRTEELGSLNLFDLGEQHIGGDTKETWGVLISYHGEEVVGRYEAGGGPLSIDYDRHGHVAVDGMSLRQVFLPAITIGRKKPVE
jgi:hypothetical protein